LKSSSDFNVTKIMALMMSHEIIDLTGEDVIMKQRRKSPIPKVLKVQVWETYIGRGVGEAQCNCCKREIITPFAYHCGHVISEANGGKMELYNLRPVCARCNLSMGKKDMRAFMKKCNFGELEGHAYDMEID
jgi:5-methylcytosine-specific restriction endonuclease McrA